MEIRYVGHSSFHIKTKDAKIITDPFNPAMVGLKYPKTDGDIVTISHHHNDHDFVEVITGTPLVIDWAGEFEKNKVRIFGFKSYHDKNKGADRGENILYKFEAEGLSVLHCGDLGLVPDDGFVDEIGEVDILMVPVGGFFTIHSDEAVSLIKKVDPSIVIPMHYNNPKLNQEQFGKLDPVDTFIKKIGMTPEAPMPKLVIKKEDIGEEMKVVIMDIGA